MGTSQTWGVKFTGLRAILAFLVATLLSGIVVVASALTGVGTPAAVTESMLELLQFFALLLSLLVAIGSPPQLPATRTFRSDPERRTLRTAIASAGELLAIVLALPALVGLLLFTEGVYGFQPATFFGLEPTALVNGPVSLGLLCVAVVVYVCSVVVS